VIHGQVHFEDDDKLFVVSGVLPYLNGKGTIGFDYMFSGYYVISGDDRKFVDKPTYHSWEPRFEVSWPRDNFVLPENVTKDLFIILKSRLSLKCFTDRDGARRAGILGWMYAYNDDSRIRQTTRKGCAAALVCLRMRINVAKCFCRLYETFPAVYWQPRKNENSYREMKGYLETLLDAVKYVKSKVPQRRQPDVSVKVEDEDDTDDRKGYIYLIRPSRLNLSGTVGYVGQTVGLELARVKTHLRGGDPCTRHLIDEIRLRGDSPSFELFGPYPKNELNWRERAHFCVLQEAGWNLRNRKQLWTGNPT